MFTLFILFIALATVALSDPEVNSVTKSFTRLRSAAWNKNTQTLLFVDPTEKKIISYKPENQETNEVNLDKSVLNIIPTTDDETYIASDGLDVLTIKWDGKSSTPDEKTVVSTLNAPEDAQIGVIRADETGAIYLGTFVPPGENQPPDHGGIYRCDPSGHDEATEIIKGLRTIVGITFTNDYSKLYFSDWGEETIYEADTQSAGKLAYNKVAYFDKEIPTGITSDKDGNVWIPFFKSNKIVQMDPAGQVLRKIDLPVKYPLFLEWGGADLDCLYVTTVKEFEGYETDDHPWAGSILEIKGLATSGASANLANAP